MYPTGDSVNGMGLMGPPPPEMSLAEMAAAPEYFFVKTHEMPLGDLWPAIHLVRDGRDTLVSYAHYILQSEHGIPPGGNRELFLGILRELIAGTGHFGGWGPHVLAWTRRTAPTHIVHFEDLITDPGKELEDALVALGRRRVTKRVVPLPSFRDMHKGLPLLFRKGKVGSWREEMPRELQDLFWRHHREAMEALGYASPGPGLAYFFSPDYERRNRAVLGHLESLGLPLSDCRVLELGSGPGDHTGFYVQRNCAIVSVDSRQACLNMLMQRFPHVQTLLSDPNFPAALRDLGTFEVIHCYGILYHLERPADLISFIGQACSGFAVVETRVSADARDHMVGETNEDYTQSSTGRGRQLTRKWVFEQLHHSFPFVYQTRTQPPNPEFPTNWNDLTDAPPLVRAVFVASKYPLDLPSLSAVLLDEQEQLAIGAEDVAHIAAGRCGEWISAITTVWGEAERRERELVSAVATINEQAQRASVLEAAAAERLAAMQDRDREIQAREKRIAALESTAAERLAAMQDRDREIQAREKRIVALESTAAERLAAMQDRDREIQAREKRIAALESTAAERLAAMQDRDREIQAREKRIAALESAAAERLAAMQDRDREIQAREKRIAALESTAAERLAAMAARDQVIATLQTEIAALHERLEGAS
jgi:hypothetical protein